MEQNQMLFYIMAIGCTICIMIGIVKKPAYLLVLAVRGFLCSVIIYGIHIFCTRNGVHAPVDLNFLSIGTGALLGMPGIIVLYAVSIFV